MVPAYLHLSMNLKLVFAYVLGLVSMVVFRPWLFLSLGNEYYYLNLSNIFYKYTIFIRTWFLTHFNGVMLIY